MGELGAFREWEEMLPDALGLVFRNLPLEEVLTVIPRVCKSWGRAVAGPYMWQDINLEEWSERVKPDELERLLRVLLARSCGSVQRIAVSGLPTDALFSLIADK